METNNSSSPSKEPVSPKLPSTSYSNKGEYPYDKKEIKTDRIEIFIKVIGPVLTAVGLFLGAWQFQHQQGVNDEQDFKRRIWEKRLEAYMEIGGLTGKLITAKPNTSEFDSLQSSFQQLYWGKMPLFDDDSVELRMKKFNEELIQFQTNKGIPRYLKLRGLSLMHTCQKSLYQSWMNIDKVKSIVRSDSSQYNYMQE